MATTEIDVVKRTGLFGIVESDLSKHKKPKSAVLTAEQIGLFDGYTSAKPSEFFNNSVDKGSYKENYVMGARFRVVDYYLGHYDEAKFLNDILQGVIK